MDANLNKTIYFPHFDLLRFVAAFMIVIVHAYEAWLGWYGKLGILTNYTYKDFSVFGGFAHTLILNLGIGVDVFFLISGFLITYLLLKEKKENNDIDLKKFYIRRILRIWPLYFLLIAITPFLIKWLGEPEPDYVSTVLFYNNFHTIKTHLWTFPFAHFWSICIEEHFYLFWPLIIMYVPHKKLFSVFIFIICTTILFRVYICYTSTEAWYTLYLHTLARIDVLVIGAIGGYIYFNTAFEVKLSSKIRYCLYCILLLSFCIERTYGWDSTFLAAFKTYFYTGLISVILLDFNFNRDFPHFIKPNSIFHYFGKVSYGIYLYGNILLIVIIKKIMWPLNITSPYLFFGFVFVLSILIPIISYELFEKLFLKLKTKFQVVKTRQD